MKEIAPKFEATAAEERWYSHWMQKGYFRSVPDNREPYTIVIPPPNVTGVLHMGHMLNNTIQDILIRRARMLGKNALWVPGTDHASIATEAKVVNKLKQEGIEKAQLTRDEFLKHAWEWKEKHGGIILEQLKKLGASCDWDRTVFTMDEPRYESVIKVFVDLYNKGLIYRGVRMVNWDPKALTALSDEEVIYKEVNSKLFYLRYKVVDSEDEWITIATTRPETILGDTAVCVHPNDERYQHLHGRKVLVPLVNRAVPVIADEYVDMEFGTGCLKITPAHDINDYNLGIKYKLDTIDIFNDNGTLSEAAQLFVGKDRFEVRELIIPELDKAGNLVKIEAYLNKIGFSERTDAVIEPKLSLQWFLKMEEMAKPALEVVMNDTIAFHPPKFKNTYRHWIENVRDWCISRQLWWGQRIPAWYLPNREIVVASTQTEALALANKQFPELNLVAADLKQDEDVLDTWFSSWLWPVSVFDGIRFPENEEIKYYYPTNDLITAPEILFFWVARMIMAGQEYRGNIPFRNVYLTGIVRDKLGRKMSKSLGNSPDPIALMEKYGADGVRVGMLLTSPAGNDLPFDESLCEQGRNFSNKIWNALRLVTGWNVDESLEQPSYASQSVSWFEARFAESLALINEHFDRYRLSDALMAAYKLVWDDFCSWYLEMVKPAYQQPIDAKTYQATLGFFNELLKMLHPFMPFITEEMYHLLNEKPEKDLIVSTWPQMEPGDTTLLADFDFAAELINAIRALRQEKGIANREKITLMVTRSSSSKPNSFDDVVVKLCNLEALEYVDEKPQGAFTFLVKTTEFSVPAGEKIDVKAEIAKLEADLKYAQGFLRSVMGKLNNAKFMAGAPAQVVENELKKKADAETRIKAIEEQIESLS